MKLFDGRTEFYQYDTNQKLICDSCQVGEEIHFSNDFYVKAAVCLTYEFEGSVVVNVPNAYLLTSGDLIVYRMYIDDEGRSTVEKTTFTVNPRKRPSDYVYTETEVRSYETLEKRIEELEKGGSKGEDGATFIPNVDADGNLSWTNDKGLENPETVNIKGKDGIDGDEIGLIQATPSPDGKSTEVEILVRKGDTGEIYRSTFDIPNGEDGEDGYTPERGKDYWTEADKAEIKSYVDDAILGGAW